MVSQSLPLLEKLAHILSGPLTFEILSLPPPSYLDPTTAAAVLVTDAIPENLKVTCTCLVKLKYTGV